MKPIRQTTTSMNTHNEKKPSIDEYVIAKVVSHSKKLFTVTLPEYDNCEAQMLPENICASKWYSDVVKACPLKRLVVCQVASVGTMPMLVMSSISPNTKKAVNKYWKQMKLATNCAKKCARKLKLDPEQCFNMIAAVTSAEKSDIIAGQPHKMHYLKHFDMFSKKFTEGDFNEYSIAKNVLDKHAEVFGLNYHQNSFKIALVLHTPNGVDTLNSIVNKIITSGNKDVFIEVWRNEPPIYQITVKSLFCEHTNIKSKIIDLIKSMYDEGDGELAEIS